MPGHGVFAVASRSFAPVRETGAGGFKFRDQGLPGAQLGIESEIGPRCQAKSSFAPGANEETHGVSHFGLPGSLGYGIHTFYWHTLSASYQSGSAESSHGCLKI